MFIQVFKNVSRLHSFHIKLPFSNTSQNIAEHYQKNTTYKMTYWIHSDDLRM